MPPEDQGERTEAPTQRRRDEARQRGQIPQSADLSSAALLLGGLIALNLLGGKIFGQLRSLMASLLDCRGGPAWDVDALGETLHTCLWGLGMILLPLLAAIMLVGIASHLVQTGFVLTAEPLRPSIGKLNPLDGLRKLFSRRALMRLLMSLGKVGVIALVGYLTIAAKLPAILSAAGLGFSQIVPAAGDVIFTLGVRLASVLLVLALMDYGFQRWQHEQDLKMSKEEVREDLKRMEGDPQIRARRQRVARQLAMQRMSLEVPKATVVVTNPTHLAVALLYREGMNAPKVLAKGAELTALRIRQIAAASGVPIVERRPLAQALYKSCRVGDEVPVNLYKAVAEVLAYVYALARQKKIGRRIPAGV